MYHKLKFARRQLPGHDPQSLRQGKPVTHSHHVIFPVCTKSGLNGSTTTPNDQPGPGTGALYETQMNGSIYTNVICKMGPMGSSRAPNATNVHISCRSQRDPSGRRASDGGRGPREGARGSSGRVSRGLDSFWIHDPVLGAGPRPRPRVRVWAHHSMPCPRGMYKTHKNSSIQNIFCPGPMYPKSQPLLLTGGAIRKYSVQRHVCTSRCPPIDL